MVKKVRVLLHVIAYTDMHCAMMVRMLYEGYNLVSVLYMLGYRGCRRYTHARTTHGSHRAHE